MKKLAIIVLIALLCMAVLLPAMASAHPMGKGNGCGCHRVEDKVTGSIHTGYAMSDGANGNAAACLKCHD